MKPDRHRPPEIEEQIKYYWENTELTAEAIGKKFSLSKNAIVGLVHRRGWKSRKEEDDTGTFDYRINELNRIMDEALERYRNIPNKYVPMKKSNLIVYPR